MSYFESQSTVVPLPDMIVVLFKCSFKHNDSSVIPDKQIDLALNLSTYYN
jgi:hypothetical protein